MWEKELKEAIFAGLMAKEKILEIYKQDFDVEIKDDNSPVTIADKTAFAINLQIIKCVCDAVTSVLPFSVTVYLTNGVYGWSPFCQRPFTRLNEKNFTVILSHSSPNLGSTNSRNNMCSPSNTMTPSRTPRRR